MGLFDKFKKQKPEDGNFIEHSMAEKIQDEAIEPGIPQDLSVSKKSNMNKVALAGGGLFAVGLIVSGLMTFLSGQSEETAEQKPLDSIKNNQPKNFDQDKTQLALEMPERAPAEASAPDNLDIIQTEPAPTQTTTNTEPKEPPIDRRLTGEVLVVGGSADAGNESGQTSTVSLSGNEGSSQTALGNRLKPTGTARATAQRRADVTYLLPKGTNIPCTLDTQIITTHPGFTRCLITRDVYSSNGKVLLLERGSKLVGEQTTAMLQGQARVFVLWNEAETPNGVQVNIASPGAGQLGAAGHEARVDYHFFQRFGGALLISLISDLSANLNDLNKSNGNSITIDDSKSTAEEMATEALKNSINIPPTGYVNQGALINVMASRDVDFSGMYEVITPYY